jgi:hypothetical protein
MAKKIQAWTAFGPEIAPGVKDPKGLGDLWVW